MNLPTCLVPAVISVAIGMAPLCALADDPANTAPRDTRSQDPSDLQAVAYLGSINVDSDSLKITRALQIVKRSLTAKLSNDPAHADDIVCRISYVTGYHTDAYLRCSTNREIARERREMEAHAILTNAGSGDMALSAMEHMRGVDPTRFFAQRVNAAKFQELMTKVSCADPDCKNNGLVIGSGGD